MYVFHERRQIELPDTMTQIPVGVRAVLKQREKTRTGTFKGKSQEKYIKNGHILEKWVEFAVKKESFLASFHHHPSTRNMKKKCEITQIINKKSFDPFRRPDTPLAIPCLSRFLWTASVGRGGGYL